MAHFPAGKIHTNFYKKPTTKNLFVHYRSALPLSAKHNYIKNELKRIQDRCSNTGDKIIHTNRFMETLEANGYPTPQKHHTAKKRHKENKTKTRITPDTCFLKLPHFNEATTKAITRAIHKENLNIRLAHTGPSIRQYLAKKTHNNNTTCTLANCPIQNQSICHKTYTIYRLTCLKCGDFYIGSSIRPLHIRIKEHLNARASSFYKHLEKCKNANNKFYVKIEETVRNIGNLRIKESLLISKLQPRINARKELNSDFIIE